MVGSLIAAASLVLILSVLALWIRRVVLDSDGYNTTTAQLLQQPEIQQALSHEPGRPALRKRRRRHPDPAAPAPAGPAAGGARPRPPARLRLARSRAPAGLGPRPAGVDQGERGGPRAAGAGAGRRREPPENGGRRGLDQHQRPRAEPGQPARAEPDHEHRRRKDRDLHLRPAIAGADAGTLAEGAGLGAAVRLAGPVRAGGVPGDRLPARGRPQLRDRHHRGRV